MNTSVLARAVYERLVSDSGSGGLFENTNGPLWDALAAGNHRLRRYVGTDLDEKVAPGGKPLVVFNIEEAFVGDKDLTFKGDGATARVIISIYSKPQAVSNDPTTEYVQQVQARIFGDATLNADTVPTYGLHRHPLVLSGEYGWKATQIMWERSTEQYDEKYHVVTMTFATRMVRGE